MRVSKLKPLLPLALVIIGAVITFTPFYTFGLLLVITALWVKYPLISSGFFHPVSTRLITAFLTFSAWVMLTGTYGWIFKLSIPASIIILLYILIHFVVYFKVSKKTKVADSKRPTTFVTSIISGALSLIGIGILFASFYLPQTQLSSSVQIITNGYDNTAHLSLINTTYSNDGYVYGAYDDIKTDIGWKTLTAYPQGWHLATSFIWKGLNLPLFTETSAPLDINVYLTTLFVWYFIALFLLFQLIWYILKKVGLIQKLNLVQVVSFTGLAVILQLLVFWGSLAYGFATFLCALAYLFLLAGIIFHAREYSFKKNSTYLYLLLTLAILSAMAITQGWLFALPIAALSTFCGFFFVVKESFINIRRLIKPFLVTFIAAVLLLIPIVIQIAVNQLYSTQGGNQINDDGGIFAINTLLAFGIIIASCITLVGSRFVHDQNSKTTLSILVIPALLMTTLLYAYQLLTLGHTAYFFTKSLALTLCLLWIPLTVFVFSLINKIPKNTPKLITVGVLFIVMVTTPLMLGQDLSSFNRLLQRNSNLTTEDAAKVASVAENGDLKKKSTIILTQGNYDGDAIGSIFTTMQGVSNRDRCIGEAMWTIVTRRNNELPYYLNKCTVQDKDIQVIISERTDPEIIKSFDSSVDIVSN